MKLAQTQNNLPTTQVAKTKPVINNPPSFTATDWFPNVIVGFRERNIPAINGLTGLLNMAMFYTSDGQVHMQRLREQNFIFATDQIPDTNLRNLMSFSKLVYQTLFTHNGQPYQQALDSQQIAEKVNLLQSSPFLLNLSATSPTSQLAAKIGGNVREFIFNYLQRIR
jgi:hypothetical protein